MPAVRAILIYAVLTVALTWPFAANLRVMDAGDSAFFAWEIGWTVHALKTDPASLPHGNIFHPLRYTLGMDEPVFGTTLLVLPLALVSDDAVLLYNVVRLLTFLASALTACWLARELGASEWIALAAGALFAFSPIRTDQVAHLSTLGTQWWPLVLLFTIRFAKRGRPADALRRRARVRARLPRLRLPRRDRRGRAAALPRRALLGPMAPAEVGCYRRRARGPRAAAAPSDAPEGARAGALRARRPRRRSSTRRRSNRSSRRAPGTACTGKRPTAFAPKARTTCSLASWCRRWSWPARSCCGGGASGRPARPGRSRLSSRRPRSWRSARGSAASGPTSAPGPGRCCGRRCRFSR